KPVLPPRPAAAGITIVAFTAVLYIVELVDLALHGSLNNDGVVPRTLGGLDGIVWAPLLHGGWAHLLGNTIPVVVFGFLAMANGIARWAIVTAMIWIISGLGVWLTGET